MFIAGEPLYIGSEISARLNLLQPPPALPPLYERWGLDRWMSMMMVVLLFYIYEVFVDNGDGGNIVQFASGEG